MWLHFAKETKAKEYSSIGAHAKCTHTNHIGTLQKFLKRVELLLEACEHWWNRATSDSFLGDIYDGEVWEFLKSDAACRFLTPHYYLLSMNIDWFQPFVHGTQARMQPFSKGGYMGAWLR